MNLHVPIVLVERPFKVKAQSLLNMFVAGPACRDTHQVYKDEDILGECDDGECETMNSFSY